jgi:hypothetical protein
MKHCRKDRNMQRNIKVGNTTLEGEINTNETLSVTDVVIVMSK